jgi:hypothetical protein
MAATLKLTRDVPFGIELRRGRFQIFLNQRTSVHSTSRRRPRLRSNLGITRCESGRVDTRAESTLST